MQDRLIVTILGQILIGIRIQPRYLIPATANLSKILRYIVLTAKYIIGSY